MHRQTFFTLLCFMCLALMLCSCHNETAPKAVVELPVRISTVTKDDVPIYIETIGTVASPQTVLIKPQVGGEVVKAYVQQGQYVKKDDPLFQIDPRPYQAALDQAEATLIKDQSALEFANIRVKRYRDLTQKEFFAQVNYEQYVTEAEAARAQVLTSKALRDIAAINLIWTSILSPLDGKVSFYNIDPGNVVVANDTNFLIDIRQIDPIDVYFNINQSDFIAVQKARQTGELVFEAILPQHPDQPRTGSIYFIDNHIDTSTGTIAIRGKLPNADAFFWPGEFVMVQLKLHTEANALLIPQHALQVGQNGPFVYVYQQGSSTVQYRPVVKGAHFKDKIAITKGLQAGETVVTEGQLNLKPNVRVAIINDAGKGEAAPMQSSE
jgi:multidrug efflux system membrane fusion protein